MEKGRTEIVSHTALRPDAVANGADRGRLLLEIHHDPPFSICSILVLTIPCHTVYVFMKKIYHLQCHSMQVDVDVVMRQMHRVEVQPLAIS